MPTAKGMGSAYGGQWKPNPNKPNDMIFIGPPNTIQRIFIPTGKGGYWAQVKYGDDGWATAIRHETDHGYGNAHSNPHDHYPMAYDPHTHAPDWGNAPEINYWDTVPEFKMRKEQISMINWDHIDGVITNLTYDAEALRFKTISEFKDCVNRGAEIVIEWKGAEYGIFWDHDSKRHYIVCNSPNIFVFYDSPDELLEYRVGDDRLRDVITQVTVIDRTL